MISPPATSSISAQRASGDLQTGGSGVTTRGGAGLAGGRTAILLEELRLVPWMREELFCQGAMARQPNTTCTVTGSGGTGGPDQQQALAVSSSRKGIVTYGHSSR